MAEALRVLSTLPEPAFELRGLAVRCGNQELLRNVNLRIQPRQVFGIIGPSGVGKSTLLRCINRLIDLIPQLAVSGEALFEGESIYRPGIDLDALRARIGMLFQQPVVFPKSIYQNVIFGARRLGRVPHRELPELAERVLTQVCLWREVRDRMHEPALRLSVGQQQRLCLARALAVSPEIILMDEPTSALDPKSSEAIEELILELKESHTIVLVSHNLGQVRRVADWLACICMRDHAGEVVESACCDAVFKSPQSQEVIHFLSGSA